MRCKFIRNLYFIFYILNFIFFYLVTLTELGINVTITLERRGVCK